MIIHVLFCISQKWSDSGNILKLPCISLMGVSYVQGPVLVGQPVTSQEGSAAGQLRLMTAQHHAQQHQPPPGILQSPTRPVNTSHIPPDQLLTYQVHYIVNIKFTFYFFSLHIRTMCLDIIKVLFTHQQIHKWVVLKNNIKIYIKIYINTVLM